MRTANNNELLFRYTGNPGNPIPRDCKEVYQRGCTQDGVYTIDPHCPNQKPFKVNCNNQYTVFQRRMDESVNVNSSWNDYASGIGSVYGEYTNVHTIPPTRGTCTHNTTNLRYMYTQYHQPEVHVHTIPPT